MTTGYNQEVWIQFPAGARDSSLPYSIPAGSGDPTNLLTNGYRGIFSGDKVAGVLS
jgi:hypothetical protein